MEIFLSTNPEELHHAYYFIGPKDNAFEMLESYLSKHGYKTSGNPDFVHLKFETLKIEEAREISASQERKDFSGKRKFFVIEVDFITEEAQNSLLKVLEEPTIGTHFFFISPQEIILPTLKSRMQIVSLTLSEEKEKSLLKLNMSERLNMVKDIVEAIGDEDATKQDAINFLNKIVVELYNKGVEKNARELELCEKSRASLYDRGAPVKMILEQLVLSI